MIASSKVLRSVVFLGASGAVVLLFALLVVLPLLSHFQSRSEEISENAVQLAHFRNISRQARAIEQGSAPSIQPFLAGSEERVVSADLQAALQALATTKGLRVLGLRGLQSGQISQLRTVAVGLDMEGSLGALREVISAIEAQTPFLFITDASLRTLVAGDDSVIRAELKVEGMVREFRGNGFAPSIATERQLVPEVLGAVDQR